MKELLHRTVFRKWSWDKTEKQTLSPSAGLKDWMWPKEKGVFYNSLLCQWLLPGTHLLNPWHSKEVALQASENLWFFFFLWWALLRSTLRIFFLFIYSFMTLLGGCCWSQAFSSFGKRGLVSSCAGWASYCNSFFCGRAQALRQECFSSCNRQTQ